MIKIVLKTGYNLKAITSLKTLNPWALCAFGNDSKIPGRRLCGVPPAALARHLDVQVAVRRALAAAHLPRDYAIFLGDL